MVCAVIFLGPALRAMLGLPARASAPSTAILGRALPANDERQDYLRATLKRRDDGQMVASTFEKQDSSMFALLARSDCLIVRPPFAPAAAAGAPVPIVVLGQSPLGH